nr:unnamed protein product [Spirometra erinaceieuropaei]
MSRNLRADVISPHRCSVFGLSLSELSSGFSDVVVLFATAPDPINDSRHLLPLPHLMDLRITSERRKRLFLTNTEIKAQLSDKIGQLSRVLSSSATEAPRIATTELEEAIESLKLKLRESERHCTLESLRYEELLLDIESSQMHQRHNELESILLEKSTPQSNPTDKSNHRDLVDLIKPTTNLDVFPSTNTQGINQDGALTDDWETFPNNDEWTVNRHVPAPRCIALEKQMVHSVIISWKAPEFTASNQEEVTAYHVYADGQFRTSVGDHEKLRALVENIDASKGSSDSQRCCSTQPSVRALPANISSADRSHWSSLNPMHSQPTTLTAASTIASALNATSITSATALANVASNPCAELQSATTNSITSATTTATTTNTTTSMTTATDQNASDDPTTITTMFTINIPYFNDVNSAPTSPHGDGTVTSRIGPIGYL